MLTEPFFRRRKDLERIPSETIVLDEAAILRPFRPNDIQVEE